jgi:hypothetical protein
MAGLSITRAWNEGSAFVRQEAGALFLIVFGLSVLPGIIAQVVVNGLVAAPALVPGAKPDPERLIAALGITFAAVLPAILLSLWGNLTVVLLVLRRQSVIGGALRLAAGRILPLLGASVVLLLGLLLLFLPPAAILAGAGERQPGLFALVFLLLLPIMLFVAVRVLLMTPVAAAEAAGPLRIIARSWSLTSGHFAKLLGFLALALVAMLVTVAVVGIVGGLLVLAIAGKASGINAAAVLMMLLSGAAQAVLVTFFLATVARIYAQLAGDSASGARVFD